MLAVRETIPEKQHARGVAEYAGYAGDGRSPADSDLSAEIGLCRIPILRDHPETRRNPPLATVGFPMLKPLDFCIGVGTVRAQSSMRRHPDRSR